MKKSWTLRSFPAWNLIEYLLLRGFAGAINFLPIRVSTWLARLTGEIIYYIHPKRRRVVFSNLDIAFGNSLSTNEKKALAKETFCNLVTSLIEFFRIPSMLSEAAGRFTFEGTEHMDQAFHKGKGVIFAISHIGPWEYMAFLPFLKGYPCSVVVRPIKNPYIDRWIQSLREKTTLKPIDKAHSAKKILKLLKHNELVAILTDQWAGPEGMWIDFFGRKTSTTSIPARLAKRTQAAIIPGYCLRTSPGKYRIVIRPEILVPSEDHYEEKVTGELNHQLESEIHEHPSQWSWAHKRWKSEERYLRKQIDD